MPNITYFMISGLKNCNISNISLNSAADKALIPNAFTIAQNSRGSFCLQSLVTIFTSAGWFPSAECPGSFISMSLPAEHFGVVCRL